MEETNMKKNKFSGSDFHDFLKEEGIYEEVTTEVQIELEEVQDKGQLELNNNNELPNNLRTRIGRFFQRIRHAIHL